MLLQATTIFLQFFGSVSNVGEMTYYDKDEYSLNIYNLTLVTSIANNYTVHKYSNKELTDMQINICSVSSCISDGFWSADFFRIIAAFTRDYCSRYILIIVVFNRTILSDLKVNLG